MGAEKGGEDGAAVPERLGVPGTIGLTRGDGTHGRIVFSISGVGFDFNADGTVDMSVPSCAAAAQCSGLGLGSG